MKAKQISKKKVRIESELKLEKAMGAAYREQYLEENPHGFRKVKKVHRNKKKYSRKGKKGQKLLK